MFLVNFGTYRIRIGVNSERPGSPPRVIVQRLCRVWIGRNSGVHKEFWRFGHLTKSPLNHTGAALLEWWSLGQRPYHATIVSAWRRAYETLSEGRIPAASSENKTPPIASSEPSLESPSYE